MERKLEDVVQDVIDTAYSDSHVSIARLHVLTALLEDIKHDVPLPSEQEVEWLVMGREEEDGDCVPPEELRLRYPHLSALLDSVYQ